MNFLSKLVATCAIAVLGLLGAPAAKAATLQIVGGETTITVTNLYGLTPVPLPFLGGSFDTSGPNPTVTYQITGGSLDTDTGQALIEHRRSGLLLVDDLPRPRAGLLAFNFLIDTAAANVSGGGVGYSRASGLVGPVRSGVSLFDFGTGTELPGIQLLISERLAGGLTRILGAPDLTGQEIGYATTAPEVVPLPASALLLLGGLGLFGAAAWRKRAT